MKLLLDTHTLLWMSLDDPQLSQNARDLLADTGNELWLSPASYWEIAIKMSLDKYTLSEPLDEFVNREIQNNQVGVLPIEPKHSAAVATLPYHHRDPFDRMMIAQSIVEQMAIVSKDKVWSCPKLCGILRASISRKG